MKLTARIYWGMGALAVIALAGWAYLAGATAVTTVTVKRGTIIRAVSDTGYVQPVTNFDIDALQNGRVLQVPVAVGDNVRQGQTLLVIVDPDLNVQLSETATQLAQATAGLAAAVAALATANLQLADSRSNYVRYQQLYEGGAASQSDYDQALLAQNTAQQAVAEQAADLAADRSQVSGLQQTLGQQQSEQAQLTIAIPVDGVILSLPVKAQQVVLPGAALVSLAAGPGQLEVRADILSDDMADVRLGQTVSITAPVLGTSTLTGTVVQIYPQAEEEQSALGVVQRRVPVIITLPAPQQLQSGYEVQVAIQTATSRNVPLVPVEAVRTDATGEQVVMLVSQGRVYSRIVQTGISDSQNIEITSGLQPGDIILSDSSLSLSNGTRVKPAS
jgi:HlyD family secretion protein